MTTGATKRLITVNTAATTTSVSTRAPVESVDSPMFMCWPSRPAAAASAAALSIHDVRKRSMPTILAFIANRGHRLDLRDSRLASWPRVSLAHPGEKAGHGG